MNQYWKDKFKQNNFRELKEFINSSGYMPRRANLFTPYEIEKEDLKAVIVNNGPYIAPSDNPDGLAFSSSGFTLQLKKIKENLKDLDIELLNPRLDSWQEQGIMLLNCALTVPPFAPEAHNLIWKPFMTRTFQILNWEFNNLVFMFWGSYAQSFMKEITNPTHTVLKAEHPSNAVRENRKWKCNNFQKLLEIYNLNLNTNK